MSAIRMFAYGVLTVDDEALYRVTGDMLRNDADRESYLARLEKRDEMRKMVSDELAEHGMRIRPAVYPVGRRFRTSSATYELFGPLVGNPNGFAGRGSIHVGDFRSCCVAALKRIEPFNQELHLDETQRD